VSPKPLAAQDLYRRKHRRPDILDARTKCLPAARRKASSAAPIVMRSPSVRSQRPYPRCRCVALGTGYDESEATAPGE
jgi:hypothetical protein